MRKFWVVLFLFLFVPGVVKADGGLVVDPGYYVKESEQKAIILYDGQTEHVILSIDFQGDAKDFGWVVPVPAKPEIGEIRQDIFEQIKNMIYEYSSSLDQGYRSLSYGTLGSTDTSYVEVVETKVVGDLITEVINTNDAQLFNSWLEKNGYSFPEHRTDVLDFYIKEGWYFVVTKVVAGYELEGATQPLKISFVTDKIVYPMKMTQIMVESADDKVLVYPNVAHSIDLELYILSDSVKIDDQTNGYVSAAGEVDKKIIAGLFDENLDKLSSVYLTKITANLDYNEMQSDWYFKDYGLDKVGYVSSNYMVQKWWKVWDWISTDGVIQGILGILFIILMNYFLWYLLRRLYSIKKKWQVISLWLLIWIFWSAVYYFGLILLTGSFSMLIYSLVGSMYDFGGIMAVLIGVIFVLIWMIIYFYPQILIFYSLGSVMMKLNLKKIIDEYKK